MPSLGAGELIVIFVLVLVLFGPNRLPELARGLGKGMREVRKLTSEFQSQLAAITDLDDEKPAKPAAAVASQPLRLDQLSVATASAPSEETGRADNAETSTETDTDNVSSEQPTLPFAGSPLENSQSTSTRTEPDHV